jgi:cysteine desulfurase/selenocysteine lyase
MLNIQAVRREFPALSRTSGGSRRVYLDNAATTLQPRSVIATVSDFYERGHSHSAASALYAEARARIARNVGASNAESVVFCAGATHAIHLVAESWGNANVGSGDEIVVSSAEHVANLACWQALARRRGAHLRVIPVDATGAFPADVLRDALSKRTKFVAITHISNVSGTVSSVRELIAAAHEVGARILIDGAQAVAHMPVEFDELDADFYAFSGHKAFAPIGIGVLLGKSTCLDTLPPVVLGANAFDAFALEEQTVAPVPNRFEGGTPNIAGALALAEALEFAARLGWDEIAAHERSLCERLDAGLALIEGVSVLVSNGGPVGIRSFVVDGRESFEIQRRLQDSSIGIRAGHLSAQTLLCQFGAEHALRASVAVYNDADDIDQFIAALAASVRGGTS